MRKQVYIKNMYDLCAVVKKLLESDVPDVYITDDRGGSGSWIIVAQADFLPALVGLPFMQYEWEIVPTYRPWSNGYTLGNMPEEDNDD
jgi:hypothetical protein